ncbi:hypothetical protein RHSIM_Rhsim07G0185300 [Rhododendron simsii]|uniref:Transposase-associated domain-containing protein n=1 Tax=Rhododendron simsii TaxID=118357 RepID=A0A834GQ32_RHOSS|nr:hypothetical protein RHSIM_Rhsim07G0185300 [Rhododendron simsii]
MDKNWMRIKNRWSKQYKQGVESFIEFAMANSGAQVEIRCPCIDCLNSKTLSSEVVRIHLILKGIDSSYKTWVYHGESVPARQPQTQYDDYHEHNEGIGDETGGEVPEDDNKLRDMSEQSFIGGILDDDVDGLPNLEREDVQNFEANKPNGKVPNFCERYKASRTLKDGGWIDPQRAEIHARMVAMQDEASQSGCPLTDEELSRSNLGEAKYYLRGFGVGPRPSSFSSKSSSNSIWQELQKVQSEIKLLREELRREREEYERRWEEERNRCDEEQRQWEEQQRQRDEELRLRDEQRHREFDELKAMMMRQMHGRDNM